MGNHNKLHKSIFYMAYLLLRILCSYAYETIPGIVQDNNILLHAIRKDGRVAHGAFSLDKLESNTENPLKVQVSWIPNVCIF